MVSWVPIFLILAIFYYFFLLQYLTHQTLSSSVFTTTHFFLYLSNNRLTPLFFYLLVMSYTHPLWVFIFFNTSFHWVISTIAFSWISFSFVRRKNNTFFVCNSDPTSNFHHWSIKNTNYWVKKSSIFMI